MRSVKSRLATVLLLCGSALLLTLSGCGGGSSGGGSATVSAIAITPTSASVAPGGTQQFTAVAKSASGVTISGVSFTWSSSNTGVATINSSGLATGVAAGTTNITAKASGITSNAAVLTVTQQSTMVTGTAAMGAPISGAPVTLVDSAGKTAEPITAADGSFSIDTTGLTPPFLVKVVVNSTTTLYSVSADADPAVINITPLTDLIIRSWYSVQGLSVDAGFADPVANPPPSPTVVPIIGNVVLNVWALWFQNAGVDTTTFNPINTPFTADGTGADQVLDETTINTGSGAITVTDGTTTQNSTVTYDTGNSSMSVDTTTTGPGGTSSSSTGTVVPTTDGGQTALEGITAGLSTFADTVNGKGAALTDTDVEPFLDDALLNEGLNKSQFAASIATQFRGVTISFAVLSIASLDDTTGIADVNLLFTQTQGSASGTKVANMFFKQQTDGSWLLYGNRLDASISVESEDRTNQGFISGDNGPDINVDVRPLQGRYGGVTVDGGGVFNNTPLAQGPTEVDTYHPTPTTTLTITLDAFFANTGVLANLVPAGTPLTLTLTPAAGSSGAPVSYTVKTNAFTTESISITNLTGTSIGGITFGAPTTVVWTLPQTFAIQDVRLNAETWDGDQSNPATHNCIIDGPLLGITATTGDITIPATCAGNPVLQASFELNVTGVNGERETVIYSYD